MGATLAKVVLGPTWAHLSDRPRVVLAHMATTALDDDQPPRYFGGRNPLVECLYGKLADDPKERDVQYRSVLRMLQVLKDAGAIQPLKAGHKGTQAEYELTVYHDVELANTLASKQSKGALSDHPIDAKGVTQRHPIDGQRVSLDDTKGVTERPQRVSLSGAKGVTQRHPKEQGGTSKEQEKEQESSDAAASPQAASLPLMRADARESANTPATANAADAFETFYRTYPRRKDRGRAEAAFKRALKKTDAHTIITAAQAFADEQKQRSNGDQWIPYPAKWLDGERWADQPDKPAPPSSNGKADPFKTFLNTYPFRSHKPDIERLKEAWNHALSLAPKALLLKATADFAAKRVDWDDDQIDDPIDWLKENFWSSSLTEAELDALGFCYECEYIVPKQGHDFRLH